MIFFILIFPLCVFLKKEVSQKKKIITSVNMLKFILKILAKAGIFDFYYYKQLN